MSRREVCILISSAGRRVELIHCFRAAAERLDLTLRVIACDQRPDLSAACHAADRAFAVPGCLDEDFIDAVFGICRAENVDLVVPTIDPELLPFSLNARRFAEAGTRVHVSPPEVVKTARDKLRTMQTLGGAGIPVPQTDTLENAREAIADWSWPVFAKPRSGSASRSISVVHGPAALPQGRVEPMIVQEYLRGPEYTINLFVDVSGVVRSCIAHERLAVRAGEVEKGRTVRLPTLPELARGMAQALPDARGALCIQAIDDATRGLRIIELNARFGGGYPLADRAGACFAQWLLEEVAALPLSANDDWRDGVLMLRYDAAFFEG
ncbi:MULTISPECIES: ATP-grasp domain-containing protein [Ensifer]|uniref:ATP-grasp domain-containing protein n=1 Tax=Ensifer TaxID=106591 RepID=UPI000807433F|nr:ATP-grasp domain-containing protein [Ensifer adhaerens]